MSKKIKVLVVEDEIYVAQNLCSELEKLDIIVLEPEVTGEKAIEVAEKERPDLIIMDIRLIGEMSGMDAAIIIKRKFRTPIIFITGYPTEYMKTQAKNVDCLEFFEKPVSINQLKPIIESLKTDI